MAKDKLEIIKISAPSPENDLVTCQTIIEDLDTNLLIEAVPGAGKTYNLIKRLVSLVINGKIPANKLAAITFTRKAAEELRTRFNEEITRLISDKKTSQEDKKTLKRALIEIEDGYIGTIHGFCGNLIRQFPIESDIDPHFEEIEPDQSYEMLERIWCDYLSNEPELMNLLISFRINSYDSRFLYALKTMAEHPDLSFTASKKSKLPDFKPILNDWNNLCSNLELLRPDFSDEVISLDERSNEKEFWDKMDRIARNITRAKDEPFKICGAFISFPRIKISYAIDRENAKKCNELVDEFKEKALEFQKRLAKGLYPFLLKHFKKVADLSNKARLEEGCLDFGDLLNNTAQLLKKSPETRKILSQRFSQILVDEFQDTDPIQAEILFLLTDNTGKETNWKKCAPRAGSLFIVGDPKQAIYKFRRGDIQTYTMVKKLLQKSGGKVLTLQANRRSVEPICDWVNQAFGNAFSRQKELGQIEFAPMANLRKPENSDSIFYLNTQVKSNASTGEANSSNALKIASLIKKATQDGIPDLYNGQKLKPEDFLIVARNNKVLAQIAVCLEEAGIPTSLSGGGQELSSSIREDLVPLYWILRAIALPTDPALLYAALVSPFFGFTEQEIYDFVSENGRLNIFFDEKTDNELSRSLKQIAVMSSWLKDFSPITAFRKIVKEINFYPWLKVRPEGEFKAGLIRDIERVFAANTFHDGISIFGAWIENWPSENRPGETGKVPLMSVFRAKGLEAPVVIFAGIQAREMIRPPALCIKRKQAANEGFLSISKGFGDFGQFTIAQSENFDALCETEVTEFTMEELRKDYVAVTRARDYLILSSMTNKKGVRKTVLRSELRDLEGDFSEIQIPETSKKLEENKIESNLEINYQKFRKEFESWHETAGYESFKAVSVTELAEEKDKSLFSKQSDGGLIYGTAVHAILETAMKKNYQAGKDLKSKLQKEIDNYLLVEPELEETKEVLLRELQNAIEHPIWKEAQNSGNCIPEVPIRSHETEPKNLPLKQAEQKTLKLSGTIDLIFKDKDGWKIVDYKTDRVDSKEHLEQLANWHKPQLEIYAYLWEKISGEKVSEKSLLFVNSNNLISWK
jgi:ATP-dependent helicase/nuclease subunit A